jgi:sugar phosphate isomerase/epimerase
MSDNQGFNQRERAILTQVRINAPAIMLKDGLLDKFVAWRANPEVGLDAQALDKLSSEDIVRLGNRFEESGLKPTVHGPFLDLAPGALDQKVLEISRQRYHQALEIAGRFRAEHIVFHPSYDNKRHQFYREQWLELNEATWIPLAHRARELNVRMVLENTYEETPEVLATLFETLAPHGVGFCFDLGHASAFGRVPMFDWLEAIGHYLAAVHLHDNHGDRDEHLAVGRGSIDFRSFFQWLVDHGIRPAVVTLEPHTEADLAPGLKALAELWPWSP